MKQFREPSFIFCVVAVVVYIVITGMGLSLAGTFDVINKPHAMLTVNKTGEPVTFSVQPYQGSINPRTLFHNCTDLKLENGGAWFTHEGKRKYIQGQFWIEGPLKPE